MKKVYCIIILSAIFFKVLNAQNDLLERALQKGYETEYNCAVKDNVINAYYVGFNSSDSAGASYAPYIAKLDSNGNTSWQRIAFVSGNGGGSVYKIIKTYDDNIVITGLEYVCDIWMGGSYVEKISRLTGNTIWMKTFDLNYDFAKDIIQLPDSGFWVTKDSMLYRLNSNGDSLTSLTYGYGAILKMIITPSNNIILGCDSGLLKIDTTGIILSYLPLPKPVKHINHYRDSLYFVDAGKVIYKVDSLFNLVAVDSSFYNSAEINSLAVTNNQLWILNHEPIGYLSQLNKLDFNFGNINQKIYTDFNGNEFDARDLFVNDTTYELMAHEQTYLSSYHIALKNFETATDSSYSYTTDVGVLNFYADSSFATIYSLAGINVVYPMFDIYVNVKNYGQVPINEVFINTVIDTGIEWCKPYIYGNHFNGLNIQPGDSAYIHLGWINQAPYSTSSNPNNNVNLCFWTSSPNNHMDYDHSNDNNCQSFVLKNFVGINEINKENLLSIQPNPANDELIVKVSALSQKNLALTIYNSVGDIIFEKTKCAANEKLDVSKLSAGMYVVKIISDNDVIARKFIKQ